MSDAQGSDESAGCSTDRDVDLVDQDVEANVEAALREFLDVLVDSATYRRFVEADETLQDDADAMALLREYRRKRQQMQRGGFDESVMAELKQLRTELSNDGTIQRQQAAQAELVELLQRTNGVISDGIDEGFARSTGGGCC